MSDIIGFDACAQELRRLLDEIAMGIQIADAKGADALHQAVISEARKLVEFTNRTEPQDLLDAAEVANIRKIDEAADEARRRIFGDSANAIIASLHERVSQLNQLEKAVRQQAAANEQEAKRIRLVPVRSAIDALGQAANAARAARAALSDENAEEAAVKARIEDLLRAVAVLVAASQALA